MRLLTLFFSILASLAAVGAVWLSWKVFRQNQELLSLAQEARRLDEFIFPLPTPTRRNVIRRNGNTRGIDSRHAVAVSSPNITALASLANESGTKSAITMPSPRSECVSFLCPPATLLTPFENQRLTIPNSRDTLESGSSISGSTAAPQTAKEETNQSGEPRPKSATPSPVPTARPIAACDFPIMPHIYAGDSDSAEKSRSRF